jgi:hypothetical protein
VHERQAPGWRREARRDFWGNLGIAAMVLILLAAVAVARQAEGQGAPAATMARDGSA